MACDKSRLKPINEETRAVVVGAGTSGIAAVRLLNHVGAKIHLLEKATDTISEAFYNFLYTNDIDVTTGEHLPEHFMGANLVVLSPGIPVEKILPLLPRTKPEIIGEVELGSRFLEDEAVVTITGTSGKTTTTSLCAAMLRERNFTVFAGGNLGTPLSEYILNRMISETNKDDGGYDEETSERVDIVVLELSSFQLQTSYTINPRIAVLLNISENHLDYHADMKEYIDAKMRIFRCQDENDVAIFHDNLRELADIYRVEGRRVFFNDKIGRFTESKLFGKHNVLNAEAAYRAAKELGVSQQQAEAALAKFEPLEHRLEKVTEINNILFVNDSKGTTVESLKIALQAFDRPVLLLAGGKFKGGNLEGLVPLFKEKVKGLALFGDSRKEFEKAWGGLVPMKYVPTLKEAVHALYKVAKPNDVILLSPATASYDQYPNYMARGDDFKKITYELENK